MKDWKSDLDSLFSANEQKQQDDASDLAKSKKVATDFLAQQVDPAFEEVKAQLEKHGREVKVQIRAEQAHMTVRYEGHEELDYTVVCRVGAGSAVAFPETRAYDEKGKRYVSQGSFATGNGQVISGCKELKKDDIIQDVVDNYKLQMGFQQRHQNHS